MTQLNAPPRPPAPARATTCEAAPAPDASAGEPLAVEFAGWLPAFRFFGNCGHHPQFAHTAVPPAGYRFVRTLPPGPKPARRWSPWRAVGAACGAARRLAWNVCMPAASVLRHGSQYGMASSLLTLGSVVRQFVRLLRAGTRLGPAVRFLRSRHFPSQVLLPRRSDLLFLTSIPYTFGRHPWVIEIEDVTTLFYPFHANGLTAKLDIRQSPYFPAVKALLEDDRCRGVITHMRATAEALPKLFGSEAIGRKTAWVPCGTSLPPVGQTHEADDHLDLLFTCSWHQDPNSFFLRGGLEVLRAFEILQARYPHLRLTLRTGLPHLRPRYRRILEKCWVRVIDRYLPDDEMDALQRSTHVFLLPAARIHVVSVLRAMAYGQAVVVSDGWGFREYVEHGRNGLVVPGRYGVMSWEDEETGLLREDYSATRVAHPGVVRGLVEAVSSLAEDRALRRSLGGVARRDVAEKFSLENWNRGLKVALDRATGRGA